MSQEQKFSHALDDLEDAVVKIAEKHDLSVYEVGFLLDLFAHSTLHVLLTRIELSQQEEPGK